MRLAFDDAAAHREVEDSALTADLAAGEREVQPHGNSEMLAAVDWMARPVQSDPRGQEPATALRTGERRQQKDRRHPLARRKGPGAEHLLVAALRTVQQSPHHSSIVHVLQSVKRRGLIPQAIGGSRVLKHAKQSSSQNRWA